MRQTWKLSAAWAIVAGVSCAPTGAFAEAYPTRVVRIVTGGTGTFHDVVARHLAQRLSERWQQGVILENQPAAGLTIGTTMVAKATLDGYTLLLGDRTSLAAAPSLYKSLRYDPAKDLQPIALIARAPAILAVHPSMPVANLADFIAYAKASGEPILFASAGNGTFVHMTGALFAQLADVRLQTVQFRGGGEAATALLGGHAKFSALSIPNILPQVRAGQAKALAVTSERRMSEAGDIPTAAEAGLVGLVSEQWLGMMAPARTPETVISRIGADVAEIMRSEELRSTLRAQGAEAAFQPPSEFAAFMASEGLRLKRLIEEAGLGLE